VKGNAYHDLGEQRVHNIAEPVRAYRVMPTKESADSSPGSMAKAVLPLPDRPSIVVHAMRQKASMALRPSAQHPAGLTCRPCG